ncbi:hypothetical protein F2Q68_00010561 [Brassica cretica]|uniref:Uncharacterized protein n=1 Tax=Brassica cretica TaxID=69181 RepID=A0A8S9KNE6_BRACR|nr:hypothetical protein F2Q68_00010561 [Brassica cretica]
MTQDLSYLISSFSFAITHLPFLFRWCKEWSLLRFTLLSAPLVAPLRSSLIDIRAVVRRISSLEDEVESLLKDREIKESDYGGKDSRWWRGQQMVTRVEEARTADGGEFESWTVAEALRRWRWRLKRLLGLDLVLVRFTLTSWFS